ncbi:exotoxin, partial [Bacillus sp. AFS075960]
MMCAPRPPAGAAPVARTLPRRRSRTYRRAGPMARRP